MNVRDFFILVIKLFGLYSSITAVFFIVPQHLPFLMYEPTFTEGWIYVISILLITVGVSVGIILKAADIVNALQLDKHFIEGKVNMGNLDELGIVKIACIVLGGILVLTSLPELIGQTLSSIQVANMVTQRAEGNQFYWLTSFLEVSIGVYLITNYHQVSKVLIKKKKEEDK